MTVAGVDDGDDIVWRREASYVDGNGQVRVLMKFLSRAERDALLDAFGQEWLDRYLEDATRMLDRFRLRGVN
jgi:hypothetical protein